MSLLPCPLLCLQRLESNILTLSVFYRFFLSPGDHGPPVAAEDRAGHQGGAGDRPPRGRRGPLELKTIPPPLILVLAFSKC